MKTEEKKEKMIGLNLCASNSEKFLNWKAFSSFSFPPYLPSLHFSLLPLSFSHSDFPSPTPAPHPRRIMPGDEK